MTKPKVRVEVNKAGVREMYRQIAETVSATDQAIRREWGGHPADEVLPKATAAFSKIGVDFPPSGLSEYAEAVEKGDPFQFNIR